MPHLPVASAAKKIKGKQIHFIEIQYSDSGWNVQGGTHTDVLEEVEEQIKAARDKFHTEGYQPRVLIEAGQDVKFKRVRAAIRASAKAGIDEFLFAVRQHPTHPAVLNHVLTFDTLLSHGCGCGPPVIAPQFIKVDKQGSVFINTGPAQELLNSNPEAHDLPELSKRIQSYQAAAHAGSQEPRFQVWIDGEAPYQKFIDIINLFRSHGIERENFTDFIDDHMGGCRLPTPYITPRAPLAPSIRNPITQ